MRTRNNRGRFTPSKPMDVRTMEQIPQLQALIHNGPITFILIHADWCGHCQTYKPKWKEFENTPGRKANIAAVHHDMMEKIPAIANAKIEGYPSVIKVEPNGAISEYVVPGTGSTTNAVPFMREEAKMKRELVAQGPPKDSGVPGSQAGIRNVEETLSKANDIATPQKGGAFESVMGSLVGALQAAGPAAVLMFANAMLPKKRNVKTYKSPKKSSRRASTRRNRA
jgi:thiol-disulfide isomerase/thioredoxin